MADFREMMEAIEGSQFFIQGNIAFALGVVHAGYHAADGYPGTPSSEVIDKALSKVQDRMTVGWSVNEAVAAAVGIGHSIAGFDSLVCMKTPGVFQAADIISTASFNQQGAGALVYYVATDHVPSSTQHVIDMRYFFSSCRIPVLEPCNIQDLYDMAFWAADLSRTFSTPVVVLASGILTHSEAVVETRKARMIEAAALPDDLKKWIMMPAIVRENHNKATQKRIPELQQYFENSNFVNEYKGVDDFGVIVCGEADIILKEALAVTGLKPSVLVLKATYPLPLKSIEGFARRIKGPLFLIEDGDRFVEESIASHLREVEVIGKERHNIITNWTPDQVIELLCTAVDFTHRPKIRTIEMKAPVRVPSICAGCPYRAFGLVVEKFKKQQKIYGVFGDIGCSTLLYFMNALDTVFGMGASDSVRQGFVMSRPDFANKTISVIGDSTECHSGLDATRNAVFRNIPGVKVILDNAITAMTGGQPAPSSSHNLAGDSHNFDLERAVRAEGGFTELVDAYSLKEVENALKNALKRAEEGTFTTLILKGACIHSLKPDNKIRQLEVDEKMCVRCGRCNICQGIIPDAEAMPVFNSLCSNCGGGSQICLQRCPQSAIVESLSSYGKADFSGLTFPTTREHFDSSSFPESLRLAIRGVGGQGILFMGRVLGELFMQLPLKSRKIVKGETHGMAQLGGSVITTFAVGEVHSPVFAASTVDYLIAMEAGEVLRNDFIGLLNEEGRIIVNDHLIPSAAAKAQFNIEQLKAKLVDFNVSFIDTKKIMHTEGAEAEKYMNMVVLGYLSGFNAFNSIGVSFWYKAIIASSGNKAQAEINFNFFMKGRNYGS